MGSILGYILTAIQIYYLTKSLNFNVNVEFSLILLLMVALSLPPLVLSLVSYLKDKWNYDGYIRIVFLFVAFGLFLIFLSFSSFIPTIALVLSGSISIVIVYIWRIRFFLLKY